MGLATGSLRPVTLHVSAAQMAGPGPAPTETRSWHQIVSEVAIVLA